MAQGRHHEANNSDWCCLAMSFLLAHVNSSSQETYELMPLPQNVISFGPNISTPVRQDHFQHHFFQRPKGMRLAAAPRPAQRRLKPILRADLGSV